MSINGVAPDRAKYLARVRALLAKAESTTFEEEADALTAKAQELITKYALEALLASETMEPGNGNGVETRRLILNAPYVSAKASLVDAVAGANRCRCVFTPADDLVTLLGTPGDLDAVDLLTTSLLTQAEVAMRQHRREFGYGGSSTIKSFRRAFLLAFAVRIRQRLAEAAAAVVAESADRDRLLPVLTRHAAEVDARVAELFPTLRTARRSTVSNSAGWAAGKAAADRARLHKRRPVGPS
ncbi:DUF2786 domain-containing protein [Sporichthya sp.]|uniref:DUF2786 domain-containing protein n=1 Tax=Sporichthya sp. TaxID=65475 RepID=UPI0017C6EE64|nr:DUF2786 domain-containing protein [Sporichthya sp.]MBA3741603.1 DUF2786 domain-containing protein [Sporichthya sp.]